MLESLLAGTILLASPQNAEAPYTHEFVKQVFCDKARGTAFKIAPHRYLSVNHVTSHTGCKIEGQRIFVTYTDPNGDFSMISIYDPAPGGIDINCEGFKNGEVYTSIGFARGETRSVSVLLRSTTFPSLPSVQYGWGMFIGVETVIPGMSGGPILSSDGRVVGMVNAYNSWFGLSWSRALKDTPVCQG